MINIVWFKRDLRLTDHAPLMQACCEETPLLLLYTFENDLLNDLLLHCILPFFIDP